MSRLILFGDWQFRPDTQTLSRGDSSETLEPRVARLLEHFLAHPGEVQTHDDLIDAVWDGRVVSNEAVRRAVSSLRHALSNGGDEHPIRTIHRKGYVAELPPAREVAEVPSPAVQPAKRNYRFRIIGLCTLFGLLVTAYLLNPPTSIMDEPTEEVAGVRSIAVLPFTDLSPQQQPGHFALGLADELISELARYGGFQVAARSASFRYGGDNLDAQQLGQALGVRYIIEGNVRREGNRVRIGATLIDTDSGYRLWSQQYDRTLSSRLELQREIAQEVARTLRVVLVEAPTTAS
ncbi:hypothetical protein FV139_20845 [Parahaliea maris]|uniref:OmpR/PhoB-type domain-containing protein n=1 Tax=Parahaliea maris TaxID=2716870 RepID=A0A5C8ZMZ0_9GAMM|nr:winged helix-turn-helix domain-containing protein [Parahaliea maris]TXS88927.1 hypothetical protein FV139_20845 [Parahaliea maris]